MGGRGSASAGGAGAGGGASAGGGLYKEPRGAKESPWRQDGELSKADR